MLARRSGQDIFVVILYDLNTSYARTKARVKSIANAVSTLHQDHKTRSCALVSLTDVPVKGALRGVQDDDDVLMQEFGGLAEDCDTRFAVWSDRDQDRSRTEALPSCHFGRICVEATSKPENAFLKGKLGLKRRPNNIVKCPSFGELVHTESLNPDVDVYTRERATASVEKLAAQKAR